jgi:hypothetical protein
MIKYHGFLCLQNCLVDSNWIVKLTNFATEEIISEKLRHNELKYLKIKEEVDPKKKKNKKKGKDADESSDEKSLGSEENILDQTQDSMLERRDKSTHKS